MEKLGIILIGYGRMGHEVEKVAKKRGHQVLMTIDQENQNEMTPTNLQKADVAIEFSLPDAAYNNIMTCLQAGLPVVSGTTGWLDKMPQVEEYCHQHDQAFFHAANFNIGVNLFFKLNEYFARIMNNYSNYDIEVEETHHVHKVDAPSGTAKKLADILLQAIGRKKNWKKETAEKPEDLAVKSIREDEVPGIHRVMYHSDFDDIEIKHSAKSREGFALGAVMAGEFLQGKQGVFSMDDLLNL
ncbi:MAG: 4-hydroxy-tetrahydrodipicolinate reductase [Bacteroidales bacterium]|nr:4-hydroxy-tetrahydrodipicolinate reductase [Bacteroidales bacterium]